MDYEIIKFKDGYSWLPLNYSEAIKIFKSNSNINMYAIFEDETESLVTSVGEILECLEMKVPVCIELGFTKEKPVKNWFHEADKLLKDGFWYVKISDVKFA